MRLDEIIRGIAITDRRGRFDGEVARITCDSRQVTSGDLFVAVRGGAADGHDFIGQALAKGAAGILGESWPNEMAATNGERPNVVLVPNSRRALALTAANFYGQPSKKLHVAGVTGTNGKTTVTYILESIVKATSKRVGVIGTVECRYAGKVEALDFTTPDAIVLQQKLREMLDARCTHVVMEVSSHALEQQRVAGVHFKVAGFTNLSQDHLDYHGSLEAYFEAKARLFSEALRKSRARGRMAVVNIDDPRGPAILERWGGKSLRVSIDPSSGADVVALEATYSLDGISAVVRTSKGVWEIRSALIGQHNLSNILVALGMALAMGISKARIMRGLAALERVPGRLERIPSDDGKKNVFVDYAHTPDALTKVLAALRPLTAGRLIVVFGCGGDRDKAKRALMGKAVAEGADLAIVTNDNPRSEDPNQIAAAIEQGLSAAGWKKQSGRMEPMSYRVDLDRRAAIRTGIEWLRPEDVLVVAGKGHETYQIIGSRKLRFDDREEARRILAGLPPPPPMVFDDSTAEVEAGQVEEVEIEDSLEILAEENARPGPTTESVEPLDVVEAVDLEPENRRRGDRRGRRRRRRARGDRGRRGRRRGRGDRGDGGGQGRTPRGRRQDLIARASEWTSREVAEVVGGALTGPEDLRIAGIATDTRDALAGCLFVALRGERFDAHDFVEGAVAKGARALLVERAVEAPSELAVIRVPDSLFALGELAQAHRKRMPARRVALTGSNGKTSTKEMLAAILAVGLRTLKTEGNLNNLIGLPMTVLGIGAEHEVAVIEMGMNTPGEIARYTEIVDPDVGMVINVGPAHIGMLGSMEAIARAKGELYRGLRPDAIAVVNADDPHVVKAVEETGAERRLSFGRGDADVRLLSAVDWGDGQRIGVAVATEAIDVEVPLAGAHNALNATAAIAAAHALGAPLEWAIQGLPRTSRVARRLSAETVGPYLLVDDCYNANAASMTAALTTVGARAAREGRRLVALLGEMRELGGFSAELHASVGRTAVESGAVLVAAFGPEAQPIAEAAATAGVDARHEAGDLEALFSWLRDRLQPRDVILVKGSRGIRMERFIERLKQEVE